jgi:hypothetical protein
VLRLRLHWHDAEDAGKHHPRVLHRRACCACRSQTRAVGSWVG